MSDKTRTVSIIGEIRKRAPLPQVSSFGWERLVALGLVIAAWYVFAWYFPRGLMPYPIDTLALTWQMTIEGTITRHVVATMWRTLWAWIGVMAVAIGLGTVLGIGDYLEDFFTPPLMIALSLPAVAVAAAATLIFSFGDIAPVVTAIIIIFPYLTFNIWKSVEDIDVELIKMAQSFDLSRRRVFSRIIIRDIAPALFGSSRNAVAHSWRLVTLAEIFASSSGMGFAILSSYQAYQFRRVWAWVIVFVVIILLIEYVIFIPIERRIFSYRSRE